jgi:signal transduction histidine kinase
LLGLGDSLAGILTARAVPEGFARETRQLLADRLRLACALAVIVNVTFIPVDYLRLGDHFAEATVVRLIACGGLAGLGAAARGALVARRPVAAVALVAALIAAPILEIVRFAAGPADPLYLVQMLAVVFVVMAFGSFLPLDGLAMLGAAGVPVAMHVAVTLRFAVLPNLPVIAASLIALLIAVVGAHLAFETRLREYQGRTARDALLEARSNFVAMLSHDIKNPLTAIVGFVDVLRDTLRDGRTPTEEIDAIESSAREAIALAQNFLEADKIETGALIVNRFDAELNDVVENAVRQQVARARLRHVELRVELDPSTPSLRADAALLERAVANLLHNAIKFSPPRATVEIATTSRGGTATISVRDHGPGIAPSHRPKLFQRYGRGDPSRADSTGLGLYIVKTIVEAHGGTVEVDSPAGGGSRFRISLAVPS